ncbi:MAG: hypothetical protein LQ351_002222 [Letrouitia transgressa]|nr:MAG: hypothetical protein LQ351_002222 [Letrouitia transgressa]
MFTGIVECIGNVAALNPNDEGGGTSLAIRDCSDILSDAKLGDSISINGTCLTYTHLTPTSFTVGISPETLRRTNLSALRPSSPVNLERAVSATTRMGGHFVQGHVDTVAKILSATPDGNSMVLRLQPRDKGVMKYVVEKGYVTLDGASLTITQVNDVEGWWEIMLIAYTQEKVVTARKQSGEEVNVEVDMVGKYVEKSVRGYLEGLEGKNGSGKGVLEKMVERIVQDRLARRSELKDGMGSL